MTDYIARSNSVYEKFNTPKEWQHDIDGFIFPFNPEWKTVAVNLSGGADSAMCTSLLCEIITRNNYDTKVLIISHSRVWKTRPWQSQVQIEVYNKLKQRYPNVIDQRIENFIPPTLEESVSGSIVNGSSGDRIIVGEFNHYVTWKYGIDVSYNAVTANPPIDEFNHKATPRDRTYDVDAMTTNEIVSDHTIRPFMLIPKDWIICQYLKRGWEDLLNTTRSCEGDSVHMPYFFEHDYTTYVHGKSPLPECGECFWCAEREWALNKARNES